MRAAGWRSLATGLIIPWAIPCALLGSPTVRAATGDGTFKNLVPVGTMEFSPSSPSPKKGLPEASSFSPERGFICEAHAKSVMAADKILRSKVAFISHERGHLVIGAETPHLLIARDGDRYAVRFSESETIVGYQYTATPDPEVTAAFQGMKEGLEDQRRKALAELSDVLESLLNHLEQKKIGAVYPPAPFHAKASEPRQFDVSRYELVEFHGVRYPKVVNMELTQPDPHEMDLILDHCRASP